MGGGGEIRTHGPIARTDVFKTSALGHYATPPGGMSNVPATFDVAEGKGVEPFGPLRGVV